LALFRLQKCRTGANRPKKSLFSDPAYCWLRICWPDGAAGKWYLSHPPQMAATYHAASVQHCGVAVLVGTAADTR
jgi:hypothetical protein